MKLSRRDFIIRTAIGAVSTSILAQAGELDVTKGILDSFKWGERQIPV